MDDVSECCVGISHEVQHGPIQLTLLQYFRYHIFETNEYREISLVDALLEMKIRQPGGWQHQSRRVHRDKTNMD